MPRNRADDFDNDNDDDTDDANDNPEQSKAMKQMRARIAAQDKELAEAASAKRELAFVKAGIDTDSKLGKLFLKSYDGDITDVEAIKSEATEIGLVKVDETPAPDEVVAPPTDTNDRRTLANGGMPDDPNLKGDVRATAMEAATTALDKGLSFDKAAGGFIAKLAEAAMAGDQSVVL